MLEMARSRDWVGFVLDRPMAQPPGRTFAYDSGTWHLLSAILAKKTGMDTLAYARQALFGPLGIAEAPMAPGSAGHPRRRLRPLPAAARHGQDRLPLPAPRPVGGRAAAAAGVERARLPRHGRHEPRQRAGASLRQRLVDDPRPARLHGGRLPAPADHRAARARRRRRRHRQAPLSVPGADRSRRRRRAVAGAVARRQRRRGAPASARARGRDREGERRRGAFAARGGDLGRAPGASRRTRPACVRSSSSSRPKRRATRPPSTPSAARRRAASPGRSASTACSAAARRAAASSPSRAAG